ncbi:hypothetical protein RC77_08075 [Pectobacterium brasiliense]|nr:hypothetical protein RC77_08075 [Pectobacterium brasiliense]
MLCGRKIKTQLEKLSVVAVQDIRRLSNNCEQIKVIYVHIVSRIYCLELMEHWMTVALSIFTQNRNENWESLIGG